MQLHDSDFFLKLRYHWTLLTCSSRITLAVAMLILMTHVILGTVDVFFHYYGLGNPALVRSTSGIASSFAVVINTYKRPEMLSDAVWHYANVCGPKFGINQVFIVWSELDKEPPSLSFPSGASEVEFLQMTQNSLNTRFLPIQNLRSNAIFMVDDDVRVSCSSLFKGFQAWTANPASLVGYYPRFASTGSNSMLRSGADNTSDGEQLTYHNWPEVFVQHRMNMILTKASFLHRRYLDIYWDSARHPQEVREYIDRSRNCEDIAMAMMVANYTAMENGALPATPIYVEGTITDKGLFNGISTGTGHMTKRSECLTDLTKIYHDRGWSAPLSAVFSLRESSWVHHSPDFWWQYRPSNSFEWLALGNILR